MSRRCSVCGKGTQSGHTISHAHNKSNRKWNPNLQKQRVLLNGGHKRIAVCTRCLRTNKIQKAL